MKLKSGNPFTHAMRGGQKVVFGKAPVKRRVVKKKVAAKPAARKANPVKKRVVRKVAPKQFKFLLQCKKTEAGAWSTLMGSNYGRTLGSVAKMFATAHPSHYFRVVNA